VDSDEHLYRARDRLHFYIRNIAFAGGWRSGAAFRQNDHCVIQHEYANDGP
jgi:hypothetical protein